MHYGDLTDSTNLVKIIPKIRSNEIYNLGAQSHVPVNLESPEYKSIADALKVLSIIESIKITNSTKKKVDAARINILSWE